MKKLLLLIATLALLALGAQAAQFFPSKGRVIDEKGESVPFATVVLLKDSLQVAGMTTDNEGRFALKAPTGSYTLSIQYLGYEPIKQSVKVEQENDLGNFTLRNSSTKIDDVVVSAQLIRREADRFVVDVANAPAAIGKDGIELLERAPGIWIDGEKITINGKSGSKVYINERELRMEPAQLLTYLRSLRAEEILKIEVIPITGADYDADSAGGAIKITLRKRRENGTEGSVSMRTTQSSLTGSYSPNANINIHAGKLDFYASGWGSFGTTKNISSEQTTYSTQQAALTSHSEMTEHDRSGGVSMGAVYELNPKHSIGAEFEYWSRRETGPNDTYTELTTANALTRTDSRFERLDLRNNYSATFNYIWKVDTLGSTFKVLADYTRRTGEGHNDNFSHIASPTAMIDSTYRDMATNRYQVVTATVALDKKFSHRWSLRAGAKYTYNDMFNDALYEYQKNGEWKRNDRQSLTVDYTENIVAAYGIATANLGRWSVVAGLRGEYTHTNGKGTQVGQSYFSLFPNANVSYALTKDRSYSLIAQYARTIERPRFWSLNPQRVQISDYTYQVGNPELNPSFKQDISLTLVLKYKYTFTAGMMIQKDEINQTMRPDPTNPDMLCIAWINFDATKQFYFNANLPFQLTKWWQASANATYMYRGERTDVNSEQQFNNFWFMNLSTTITLPKKFYIDLGYNYQGSIVLSNISIEPQHRLQAGIKKRFGERFTASFTVRNLLDRPQVVGATGNGFVRRVEMAQPWNNRSYQIGLTYNFKSGKAFKRKAVEAGSADEKGRL